MQAQLLKGAIVERGLTVKKVAEMLNMTRNTFYTRLSGQTSFDTEEIEQLCHILQIDDNKRKIEIFLT